MLLRSVTPKKDAQSPVKLSLLVDMLQSSTTDMKFVLSAAKSFNRLLLLSMLLKSAMSKKDAQSPVKLSLLVDMLQRSTTDMKFALLAAKSFIRMLLKSAMLKKFAQLAAK